MILSKNIKFIYLIINKNVENNLNTETINTNTIFYRLYL